MDLAQSFLIGLQNLDLWFQEALPAHLEQPKCFLNAPHLCNQQQSAGQPMSLLTLMDYINAESELYSQKSG